MGKKGIKKKTIWRTLSIGDITPSSNTSSTIRLTKTNNELIKDVRNNPKYESSSATFHPNQEHHYKLNGKLSSTSSEFSNNENSFNPNNYTKYNNNTSSVNSHSQSSYNKTNTTTYPYKRRPFATKNTNHSNFNGGNNAYYKSNYRYRMNGYNNTYDKDERTEKRVSNFDESEYTKITTPRQDVLFKKGYLSKPKKLAKSIDTNTSSSGAVSVTSTEDQSTTSGTPDNFSSIPEHPDSNFPFMFPGFVDQNGLYYVNPYITNGFEPYGSQMFMMPYSASANCQSPPFNTQNSFEVYDNFDEDGNLSPETVLENDEKSSSDLQITNADEQTTESIDNSIDDVNLKSNKEIDENEQISSSSKDDENSKEDTTNITEEIKQEEFEVSPTCSIHNSENGQFYSPMYYPYYYCPTSVVPLNGVNYNSINDFNMAYEYSMDNNYYKFKKRKRKLKKTLSSEMITDDCSEDDSIDNVNNFDEVYPMFFPASFIQSNSNFMLSNYDYTNGCNLHSQKTYLNVNVQEFHPRNYNDNNKDTYFESTEIDIENIGEHVEILNIKTKNQITLQDNSLNETVIKKHVDIVTKESDLQKLEATQENNRIKNNKTKTDKKTKIINNKIENKKYSTYAQILNGKIEAESKILIDDRKDIKPFKNVTSTPIIPKQPIIRATEWQTVKGKRNRKKENTNPIDDDHNNTIDVDSEINQNPHTVLENIAHENCLPISTPLLSVEESINISPNTLKKTSRSLKTKSHNKKNSKRKNVSISKLNGFEVIEPNFQIIQVHNHKSIDTTNKTNDDTIDSVVEVDEVFNDVESKDNESSFFANIDLSEYDLDNDFDLIEVDNKANVIESIIAENLDKVCVTDKTNDENSSVIMENNLLINIAMEDNPHSVGNDSEIINTTDLSTVGDKVVDITIDESNNPKIEEIHENNQIKANSITVAEDTTIKTHLYETLNAIETEKPVKIYNSNNLIDLPNKCDPTKSYVGTTITQYPVTEAVTKWLLENLNNEKITEPIIRLPNDPILSSKIQFNILSNWQWKSNEDEIDNDEWSTDSEEDVEPPSSSRFSKNLLSNLWRVSSHNSSNEDVSDTTIFLKTNKQKSNSISLIDTDSDYMSDSQLKYEETNISNTVENGISLNGHNNKITARNNIEHTNNGKYLTQSNKAININNPEMLDSNNDKSIKPLTKDTSCVLM